MGPHDGSPRDARPDSVTPGTDPELFGVLVGLYQRLELDQQLRVLLEHAMSWTGASLGFVFGPGDERRSLVTVLGSVPDEDPRYRAIDGVKVAAVERWVEGQSRTFEGLGGLVEMRQPWPGDPAQASVALRVDATTALVGVVWLIFDGAPPEDAIRRLERLLERATPAVDNALQVRSMRELIIKDDTASCFNRRYFEEFLPEELSRASRFRAPLSLIFFDLDNLKKVNNDHGHAVGSRTLYEVSLRVRAKIRKFDKLFRFGGDEFCIVLPETEWHGALEVAERVREFIAGRPFLTGSDGVEGGVAVTASFGIASFPLHARSKQGLIEQADRAMQRIKRVDKNAVGVAEIVEDGHGS